MRKQRVKELRERLTKGIWWAPAMNRWRDQTGIAHVVHDGGALCGARPFDTGGSFASARDAGCNPCRRCLGLTLRALA